SYPYPDGTGIEKKSFGKIIEQSYQKSSGRFLRVLLDKPMRLFKCHWNDFRTPIGPIEQPLQVWFHQICLMLAGVGLCLGFFTGAGNPQAYKRQLSARTFVLVVFLLHCAAFFFITVPRYALTATPSLLVFAGAGVYFIALLFAKRGEARHAWSIVGLGALAFLVWQCDAIAFLVALGGAPFYGYAVVFVSVAKILLGAGFFFMLYLAAGHICKGGFSDRFARLAVVALALIVLPFVCLPLRAHGRISEWTVPFLDQGDRITQEISLTSMPQTDARSCFLLVDCQDWRSMGQSLSLSINGVEISDPPLPLIPFTQDLDRLINDRSRPLFYECEDIYNSVMHAAGGTNCDLRQWFVLPVPKEIVSAALLKDKKLTVEFKGNQGVNTYLYGAYADKE
ncbi:MAG: hypothetical protein K8F91_18655, partial [Candidatus Obscuribacterales bacterium]|nr:hypothetical protein [Candidatus Obscuribacterales bacterium]